MLNNFNRLLDHPKYFQLGFYLTFILSVLLNSFILKNDTYMFIFYIVSVIFLGIGFYHKPAWLLITLTTLVVMCRLFITGSFDVNLVHFLIYGSAYLLITLISAGLMKNVKRVKEDNIELVVALANALDSRDTYTSDHSQNVAHYSVKIAEKLMLPKKLCNHIRIGALLHDIGKIGIPENILLKPGHLTNEEYDQLKNHPKIGYEMIKHVKNFDQNGVLDIVLYHHERYDGKGYPEGLKGEQIPLAARIVAVADAFDAMTSKRIYRDELDLGYALSEIRNHKGTQFDPEIVDAFLSLFEKETVRTKQSIKIHVS